MCHDDVGLQADQLLRERSYAIDVIAGPTGVHPHVATIGPTQVHKRLSERGVATLRLGIVFVAPHEHADPPHPLALLRPRRKRPRRRRATEEGNELASSHVGVLLSPGLGRSVANLARLLIGYIQEIALAMAATRC
jgi:hypothetical protein